MTDQFEDKAVIVTGASSGLGRAIAKRFGEAGANVTNADIQPDPQTGGTPTHEAINEADNDGEAKYVETDVSSKEDVQVAVDATVSEYGSLDVMVNNAGVTKIAPAEEMDLDDWRWVIDVNLTGVFIGSQIAGQQMLEQEDGGSIVNMASMMGEMGLQKRSPYCAAKGGVINLTRTLAVEWAPEDIYVNALAPGYIYTDITEQTQDSADYSNEDIRRRTPVGRYGTPEEMAENILFLARDDHFVTGEVLHADGGWSADGWGYRE
ncbi:short-chain dehydrogenase/reductase SDR [Halorhabdus utahensis DSM 12940]|uniref:Short-chain dehydrogenase/reductase SDR n=1 Tax=Halorhabdus utahensis (strain DSM 12940 / JCM 11049 / AX-2) TaxID=519442 RepID=C7NUF4_HALUD|nr:SDR family oxidoreductase [Halorhabdus utahensis]ACV11051.1 short-chain dehydrogenase/reductase SDR [Halorhabdus utahensis DSM 12940]